MLRGDKQFKTEFTGIAGARNHQRGAILERDRLSRQELRIKRTFEREIDHLLKHPVCIVENAAKYPGGGRPLDIHLANRIGMIFDISAIQPSGLLPKMSGNRPAHGGVDHNHIIGGTALVDNGIVDHSGVWIEKNAVHATASLQGQLLRADAALKILGKTALQQRPDRWAMQRQYRHMAGVEQARPCKHGQMLGLGSGRIPKRHFITAKGRHVGITAHMPAMQPGSFHSLLHTCLLRFIRFLPRCPAPVGRSAAP